MRRRSSRFWCLWVLCASGLCVGPRPAAAQSPAGSGPAQAAAQGRRVVPLTRETVRQVFPGKSSALVNRALRQGQWKPSAEWLDTVGKRYGRLLIVSDTHPSTGQDPVTRKVNPSEDFKTNLQEVDLQRMMQGQWEAARQDGKVRTLVLNGDTLEFMQTTRAAMGGTFDGGGDKYGPANTPKNIIAKLAAIYRGHPLLSATYAEHLQRGHRLVFVPGNHDRQLLHPGVRKACAGILAREVADLVLKDPAFHPEAGKHKRRKLALAHGKAVVKAQVEFHPWFFIAGDVVARHGHETDKYNSFSTPFGEYYHPGSYSEPLESALGDYIVKGVFNKMERRKPWTDNTSNGLAVAKALVQASDGNPVMAFNFLGYLLTREGGPTGRAAQAKARARVEQDIRRYVRDFGLLEKFNALRGASAQLSEEQLVGKLLAYEGQAAPPALSHFGKGHGALRRLAKLVTMLPAIARSKKSSQREAAMTDRLFSDLNVGVVAVGHDHTFRVEPRVVIDDEGGTTARASVLDTATWTDQLPEVARDAGFVPAERRGVLVVDFDAAGSHAQLMNYDPVRGLHPVNVLESEQEARAQ